jgi:hypothetical protein
MYFEEHNRNANGRKCLQQVRTLQRLGKRRKATSPIAQPGDDDASLSKRISKRISESVVRQKSRVIATVRLTS